MRPDQQQASEHVGPLAVMERAERAVENLSRIFRKEGHKLTADRYLMEVDEIKLARDAVTEYIAANDELIAARHVLALQKKWGIESANAAVERAEKRHAAAHARMKGETK